MSRLRLALGLTFWIVAGSAAAADPVGPSIETKTQSTRESEFPDVETSNRSRALEWRERELLLDDMGGLRTLLARHGMSLEIESYDEGFANPDGALNTSEGSRYAGLTDVILSLDTEAAGWWGGGLLVVDLQNTRGGNISDVVGDVQGISNIVAPPGTRFAEYFLAQELAGGRFSFKIGKQDANSDFVVSDGGGEFINSSFGIVPTVPLPTFPMPALGLMGAWAPNETILLKAGYWDGSPTLGSGCSTAIIDGRGGTVGAVGVEIRPFGGAILEGAYRVGVWRHSELEIASVAKAFDEPLVGPANGMYFTIDQRLWEAQGRNLSLFAQGGWGEADRSAVSRYFGGGLTLAGPFAARPDDVVGVGIAYAALGNLERPRSDCPSETIVELFYRLPIAGWMTVTPDLQWISRPGGLEGTAFVAGLRFTTVF